jgi:hypothetical protein
MRPRRVGGAEHDFGSACRFSHEQPVNMATFAGHPCQRRNGLCGVLDLVGCGCQQQGNVRLGINERVRPRHQRM